MLYGFELAQRDVEPRSQDDLTNDALGQLFRTRWNEDGVPVFGAPLCVTSFGLLLEIESSKLIQLIDELS